MPHVHIVAQGETIVALSQRYGLYPGPSGNIRRMPPSARSEDDAEDGVRRKRKIEQM